MARCKHLNLEITEYGTWSTAWFVNDGIMESEGFHNPEGYLRKIDVKCSDCGMERSLSRTGKLPKWLQKYVDGYYMVTNDD